MTKDFFSDGVLVYDRYYCSKPVTPLLVIKRILLAAVFCGCSFGYIVTELNFPVSALFMAGIAAALCCVFSAVFTFLKKRISIPVIIAAGGIIAWFEWNEISNKLSYFADACMLSVEGRFLYPRRFLFHRGEILDGMNSAYVEGVFLGVLLLCAVYALIISACFSGRLVPVPAVLCFVALCVPALLSERLEFSLWLLPALAALAGIVAIRRNYSGGLAVKHSSTSDYRRRIRHEERTFMHRIRSAPYFKRIEMKSNFYSKYFSVGMYCAALAAACLLIGAAIIPAGGSIDYTKAYEMITSIASEGSISQSPFEQGAASEYFTHSGDKNSKHEMLNIITPGRGEREIISVDYTGDRPFYLRGDIGIDFNGTSWTTAVSSEPEKWCSSGLKETYRPCENRVIAALLSATGKETANSYGEDVQIITTSDVTIDYLCDTSVVFLPPYTAEFSFYNNDSFDVFADYAVRVSDSAGGHVNSVRCTALIPAYTSNETSMEGCFYVSELMEAFSDAGCTVNDIYSSVVPEMTEPDVISAYEDYVSSTYLGIPPEYSEDIRDYIERNLPDLVGIYGENDDLMPDSRYLVANQVSNYLRENYTYSLEGSNNSRNPVMQFLDDTKRGHCSLYASAMTLILRELGIPARYCTGFYVEGENGGGSVLLREKNLHAWVEVYLGEYGWVTFDPTSSSAYPGRTVSDSTTEPDKPGSQPSQNQESRPEPAKPEEKPSRPAETSAPSQDVVPAPVSSEEPAEPGTIQRLLPFAPAFVGAALVIVTMIVILSKKRALRKRALNVLENLKSGEPTLCAGQIFKLILALTEEKGCTPGTGELPLDFFRRVDETFGSSLESCTELLEKMEFGSHDISDGERDQLFAELDKIIRTLNPFSTPGNPKILRIICNCTKNDEKSENPC